MSTTGIIVFLLVIAWQIVTQIIAQAKKKEDEQQRAAAASQRSRRVQGQPRAGVPGGVGGTQQVGFGPSSAGTSGGAAQDLAARRKAQLEELRLRRQNRTAGKTGSSVTPPPQRTPAPPVRSAGRTGTIESLDADFGNKRRAEAKRNRIAAENELKKQQAADRPRQQREGTQGQRRQQAAVPQRTGSSKPQALHYEADHATVHRLVSDATDAAIAESTRRDAAQAKHRSRIEGRLRNRQDLRDLFLLRELLDPPVSLRPPSELG